jgi:selenocysteine lyase/cysteine desulfurase
MTDSEGAAGGAAAEPETGTGDRPPTTPAELRAAIPAVETVHYLNTGASGPAPERVQAATAGTVREFETEVHAREDPYERAFGDYERQRERFAEFLGVDPESVALVDSTADAVARFVGALDWSAGDAAVRTDCEHPAVTVPLGRLPDGVEVRVVPTDRGRLDRAAYREAVDGARLVVLSAVTWNYGTELPVADLVAQAHDAGALVLVDAVQSVGWRPPAVADWGADAVAFAAHKWLLGPWGAGVLQVDPAVADDLEPPGTAYRSVRDPKAGDHRLRAGAPRFEVGTTNLAPHEGALAAVETLESVGLATVRDRVLDLAGELTAAVPDERLLSPADPESGLVTVDVDDPEAVARRARERGVVVRDLPEPRAVRLSVHAFNDHGDLEAALEALGPSL